MRDDAGAPRVQGPPEPGQVQARRGLPLRRDADHGGDVNPGSERRGKATLADAIRVWLDQAGLAGTAKESRVLAAWARAAGATAKRARAVRFQRGVLTVEVSSSAVMQELAAFSGEALRKAANRALGGDRIDRIVYKQRV
ncbi:MAG: DUF721 domain-containing protein [Planctomycetota bacterium]|nr:MAG: DUF721 domain-containing protein [Planctomycetota bacterium]